MNFKKGANIGNMARILTGIDALWRIFQGLSNDATFIGRVFVFRTKTGRARYFSGIFCNFSAFFRLFLHFLKISGKNTLTKTAQTGRYGFVLKKSNGEPTQNFLLFRSKKKRKCVYRDKIVLHTHLYFIYTSFIPHLSE